MDMDQAQQLFINEAEELLETMESCLLEIEDGEVSVEEHIDAIFRAAHTIKGSAGLFGYDNIVAFTHSVENALDKVRAGQLELDSDLLELMLDCHRHMQGLIQSLSEPEQEPPKAEGEALLAKLAEVLKGQGASDAETETEATQDVGSEQEEQQADKSENYDNFWHIRIDYGEDVFRDGMDPCSQLRFLQTLGRIADVKLKTRFPEDTEDFDPESCYLNVEIELESDANKQDIEEVFEFIQENSTVRIGAPNTYLEKVSSYEGDDERVGEVLVNAGAVTKRELQQALNSQRESLQQRDEAEPLGETLVKQGAVNKEMVESALSKQKAASHKRPVKMQFLKVDSRKLDHLIGLIGELVTSGAANEILVKQQDDEKLSESFGSMFYLIEQIRDGALSLRMVQVGESFGRLKRIVRDVAKELGKEIELHISGSETELDKTMVEKLSDPLMHIVRNAIDHGIESQDLRQYRGKPAAGNLQLRAYHEAGAVVIEIIDDGAGLDGEKLRARAIEREVISPDAKLTEEETYKLIFEPGFSTAEAVTNLSGRGVGMDVVKRNIEELRGQVSIESELEKGTTFRIRVPLTLAIIDGFRVSVGDKPFVIPVNMIQECLEFTAEQLSEDRNYLNLRNEVLPFVKLREILELPAGDVEREHIVVVHFGEQKAGIVVDELHGELQAVIKPMSEMFRAIKGIGGTTILGSGDIGFIVDVPQLIELASSRESHRYATTVTKMTKGEA